VCFPWRMGIRKGVLAPLAHAHAPVSFNFMCQLRIYNFYLININLY
jgi:hypothetical protein